MRSGSPPRSALAVLSAARRRRRSARWRCWRGRRAAPLGGVLGRDRWLTRQVAQREERMLAEFPTVAELLALAVTAGEGPVGALERVTGSRAGELSRELGRALAEARAGRVAGAGARGHRPPHVARAARPLRRRRRDRRRARHAARRRAAGAGRRRPRGGQAALLESAGRKEIAMMVPGRLPRPAGHGPVRAVPGLLRPAAGRRVSGRSPRPAAATRPRHARPRPPLLEDAVSDRLIPLAVRRAAGRVLAGGDPERGDVPGWVLITLMTAGLVTVSGASPARRLRRSWKRAGQRQGPGLRPVTAAGGGPRGGRRPRAPRRRVRRWCSACCSFAVPGHLPARGGAAHPQRPDRGSRRGRPLRRQRRPRRRRTARERAREGIATPCHPPRSTSATATRGASGSPGGVIVCTVTGRCRCLPAGRAVTLTVTGTRSRSA